MRPISPRLGFILATVITVILIGGSILLQRIVFKAEQNFAALAIGPTTFRVSQGEPLDLTINSTATAPLSVSGLQLSLKFDAAKLTFKEVAPPVGWKTLFLKASAGTVDWIVVPANGQPALVTAQGETPFGSVRFVATGSGVTDVSFTQEKTILAAADTANGVFVYNAAHSVQNTAGTITASNETGVAFPETKPLPLTPSDVEMAPTFGTQRILSTYVASTAKDSLVFVGLAYAGKVTVEFGTTPQLGNRAETTGQSASHVVSLTNLTPNQLYYYRILGEETTQHSRVVGAVKSFRTTTVGTGTLSTTQSDVIAFPNRAQQSSALYIFPRDEHGNALEASDVSVESDGAVKIGDVSHLNQYYEVDVTTSGSKKQVVRLTPKIGQTLLTSQSIVFDPNYVEPTSRASKNELVFAWNQKSMATVLGGAILLFLLGYLFVALARSR